MKLFVVLSLLFSTSAFAESITPAAPAGSVTTIKGRVFTGIVFPEIAPLGAVVNLDSGEILYVNSLISVLAPNQLKRDCAYEFNFVLDKSTRFKTIRLVPPTTELECDQDFPADK